MYSAKWRFGNERPIESYLPRDVTQLLNLDDDSPATASSLSNSASPPDRPIPHQVRLRENPSPRSKCSILSSTKELKNELNPEWLRPMSIKTEPRNPLLQSSIVNSSPVTPTMESAAGLPPKMMKFVMPSGPRQDGEGTEEENQGILDSIIVSQNALLVQMTLLVAGFIIGPSGESIRSIISKSGATIYSYTEYVKGKKCRVFYLEGSSHQVLHAMEIITDAVKRYKELAEGNYNGYQVDKKQHVSGVDFYYQPPPRSAVPYAASLRMHKSSKSHKGSRSETLLSKKWSRS